MDEIWKDIPGYEGKYQVSNTGKVRSCLKSWHYPQEGWHTLKMHEYNGYKCVRLDRLIKVHRLVAITFIPNPNNYPEVNHKDENKHNNNVDNLEWCTHSYNVSYGTGMIRKGISSSCFVEQFTMSGIPIAVYYSIPIAGRINGIDESTLHKCLNGKQDYAGGYKWRYVE